MSVKNMAGSNVHGIKSDKCSSVLLKACSAAKYESFCCCISRHSTSAFVGLSELVVLFAKPTDQTADRSTLFYGSHMLHECMLCLGGFLTSGRMQTAGMTGSRTPTSSPPRAPWLTRTVPPSRSCRRKIGPAGLPSKARANFLKKLTGLAKQPVSLSLAAAPVPSAFPV